MLNFMIGLDFFSFFGFSVNSVSEKIYKEKKIDWNWYNL